MQPPRNLSAAPTDRSSPPVTSRPGNGIDHGAQSCPGRRNLERFDHHQSVDSIQFVITSLSPSARRPRSCLHLNVNGTTLHFCSGRALEQFRPQFTHSSAVPSWLPSSRRYRGAGNGDDSRCSILPLEAELERSDLYHHRAHESCPRHHVAESSRAPRQAATFTLTANGSNFISGSPRRWNSSARTTQPVSSTPADRHHSPPGISRRAGNGTRSRRSNPVRGAEPLERRNLHHQSLNPESSASPSLL